ncbi:MAG: hypothetical protein V4688_07460 [Pseudomonadota bacterium]
MLVHTRIQTVRGFAAALMLALTKILMAFGSVVALTRVLIKTLTAHGYAVARMLVLTKILTGPGLLVAHIKAHIKIQMAHGCVREQLTIRSSQPRIVASAACLR